MDPITLLIYFMIAILILAIIWYVMGVVELPHHLRTIVILVAILIILLWILRAAGLF